VWSVASLILAILFGCQWHALIVPCLPIAVSLLGLIACYCAYKWNSTLQLNAFVSIAGLIVLIYVLAALISILIQNHKYRLKNSPEEAESLSTIEVALAFVFGIGMILLSLISWVTSFRLKGAVQSKCACCNIQC